VKSLASLDASAPATPHRKASALWRRLKSFAFLLTLVAVWQLACTLWLPRLDTQIAILLPAPSRLLTTATRMIASGELPHHLADSLRREAMAFVLALVAVPLGIAMGWWQGVRRQLYPVVELLRPIPPLAWIPLSILWFGLGDVQNEFIIFLGMVFPILLNTVAGVRQVDRNLVRAARSLGASESALLLRVVLKAALPQIVIGLRVGLGFGWMALVAAELVGANSGLGFLINDARSLLRTDIVVVGMLTIGVTGLVIDLALRRAAAWLLPWSNAFKS
jgi:NitT/TauT family transport system permease protein/taurine transport system permease protein